MRKSILYILLILMASLVGCTSSGEIRYLDDILHEKIYTVCGRVTDQEQKSVENCKIILIKRRFHILNIKDPEFPDKKAVTNTELLGEFHVATTGKTGDYSFKFEPLGANDVWLYFYAEEAGYAPRLVSIHHLMGTTIFQNPGNNPVYVGVVLEKMAEK